MDLTAKHTAVVAGISAAAKALRARNEAICVVDSASEIDVRPTSSTPRNSSGGGSGSSNNNNNTRTGFIDLSKLNNVLSVDATAKTAIVEPNVKMGDLVRATLEHGLMPRVVPEFPEVRVGAAFAGSSAVQSTSFREGHFADGVAAIEVVLGDGQVVRASAFENADLLDAAGAGTMGTLGIVTELSVRLAPARKFVKATYARFGSVAALVEGMSALVDEGGFDFVDGIAFSATQCVAVSGEFVDEVPHPSKPQCFSGSWDPWFYQQVRGRTERAHADFSPIDYIPVEEYLFRYNRGGFWLGNEVFKRLGADASNRFTRRLFDRFSSSRKSLAESQETFAGNVIIQDVSVPLEAASGFVATAAEHLDLWPVWLCPVREPARPTFHPHSDSQQSNGPFLLVNIGVWGRPKAVSASKDKDQAKDKAKDAAKEKDKEKDKDKVKTKVKGGKDAAQANRDLEAWAAKHGGRKTLCSPAYYSKDQFWKLYDGVWYDKLREKYAASGFPIVYEKICADEAASPKPGIIAWPSRFAMSKENNFGHPRDAVIAHQARRI